VGLSRVHLHPDIKRFVTDAQHAVDKFHFVENHKVAALDNVNIEVCQQTFR